MRVISLKREAGIAGIAEADIAAAALVPSLYGEGDDVARCRFVRPDAPACAGSVAGEASGDEAPDPRAVATDVRAAIKAGGNARPRFSARRRIPAQAFALKKYRCGTSPVSKTSDNEHTLPSLWDGTSVAVHSDKLSVQNPVGEPIPEVPQEPEEGAKVPSSVAGQDTGHVLPNQPAGAIPCSNGTKGEHELTTRVIQACAESCCAEGLAGGSSAKKVN